MPFIISLPLLVSLSWLLLTYCRLLLPIPWFHIDWITQYSFCYCVKAVLHVGTLYFNSKYFFVSSFFFSSSPSAFFFFFSWRQHAAWGPGSRLIYFLQCPARAHGGVRISCLQELHFQSCSSVQLCVWTPHGLSEESIQRHFIECLIFAAPFPLPLFLKLAPHCPLHEQQQKF